MALSHKEFTQIMEELERIENEPATECACRNCVEVELYSRLYCRDCYDMACSKTEEDMH
jgi:hypothetical protein